jgi:signal transduction histidine kinase
LLDINRLEAPSSILESNWEEAPSLIAEAVDVIQPNVDGKRLILQVNIAPDLPKLWVDRDMIVRVLINLLDNAVKYTANEKLIQVDVVLQPEAIQFSVKDDGPGIPESEKDAVFDKFYRLKTEHKKTGFGLGLAFCKLAIEAHNGRIWAESKLGEGSCFLFQLPLKPAD